MKINPVRQKMDKHSKETRSYNMSRIRSTNTKPEELARKYLFAQGFRFRKNVRTLPGCPDIVLPKYKTAVFINGCFWHMHEGCKKFVMPSSNSDYWTEKLNKNKQRDIKITDELISRGWKVITVWECELKKNIAQERLSKLCSEIKESK